MTEKEERAGTFASPESLHAKDRRAGKRESVRSQIALYYVIGFLLILAVSLAIGWVQGYQVTDFRDFLLAISGILSGPLGFIIGFYFKEAET